MHTARVAPVTSSLAGASNVTPRFRRAAAQQRHFPVCARDYVAAAAAARVIPRGVCEPVTGSDRFRLRFAFGVWRVSSAAPRRGHAGPAFHSRSALQAPLRAPARCAGRRGPLDRAIRLYLAPGGADPGTAGARGRRHRRPAPLARYSESETRPRGRGYLYGVFQHSGGRDFDLPRHSHYSGVIFMVFQHRTVPHNMLNSHILTRTQRHR